MASMTPGLAGHRGLRGDLLVQLKKSQPVTAKELAAVFDVSANAIRRHLKELEAEGLVEYATEHRKSGAPTYAFRLSADGEALFPTQYGELLTEVLGLIAQGGGRGVVREMFARRFHEQAERIRAEMPDASLEERLKAVVRVLSDQGFMAAWSGSHEELTLAEHNCAVRAVAEAYPEICAAEADFLREVLEADVKRGSRITDGCNACMYSIIAKSTEPRGDGRATAALPEGTDRE